VRVGSEVEAGRSGGGKRIGAASMTGDPARTQTESRPCNNQANQGRKKNKAQPARATTEVRSEPAVRSGEGLQRDTRGSQYRYGRSAQWWRSALMMSRQRPRRHV
jgi:hypothetical protein